MSIYGTLPAHQPGRITDHFKHKQMQHGKRLVVQYLTEWFSVVSASAQVSMAGCVWLPRQHAVVSGQNMNMLQSEEGGHASCHGMLQGQGLRSCNSGRQQ